MHISNHISKEWEKQFPMIVSVVRRLEQHPRYGDWLNRQYRGYPMGEEGGHGPPVL